MKTKEIEVYVDSCDAENLVKGNPVQSTQMYYSNQHVSRTVKARLIIELPEKKIEITESEFEDALKGAKEQYRNVEDQLWHIKQKLFGSSHEN